MIQVRYNSDSDLVKSIRDAIVYNQGYCPCKLEKTKDTKCMCKEFRDKVKNKYTGFCHCGLYESYFKEDETNEQNKSE